MTGEREVRRKCRPRAASPWRAWRALLALVTGLAAAPLPVAAAGLHPNDTARLLAGLQPVPQALDESARAVVQPFTREGEKRWNDYERRIGRPLQDWARKELESVTGGTVFYPFSGPDFPTVQQLYPGAARYVLVAIQRAGPPPALERFSQQELSVFLARFRAAWGQFARSGYFRTNDLEADMGQGRVRVGVTGPLMAFAARAGYDVTTVEPVRVNADGTGLELHPGSLADGSTWESVRLRLVRDRQEVLLDYLRIDLSDRNLKKDRVSRAFIENMAGNRTVLKAASHLPQKPHYSVLRDAVLANAPSIWQDETGIEYANLTETFTVTLYGNFTRAHRIFAPGSQSSLAQAYKTSASVRPLPFAVGYEKESGSTVQVAVRTAAAAQGRLLDPEYFRTHVAAQLDEYWRRPRKLFLTGSPSEPVHAEYVGAVRAHIARLLLAARIAPGQAAVLSLTLASDGSLRATDLARSSGSAAFDRRVRAVLHEGGPFPQWPAAIRDRADLLIVTMHLPET